MDISKDLRKFDSRSKVKKNDQSSMIYGKISPQAAELENAVLGAIMLEPQKLTDVLEIINSSECFYGNANRLIYDVILHMFKNGNRIDFLTVCEELRKRDELEMVGGSYYVTSLTRDVVSSANVEEHARIVMEKFIMRELIRISGETINDAYENGSDVFDLLDQAEEGLYDITKNHLRKNVLNISQVLTKTLEEIQAQVNKKADLTGVPTGFKPLNQITSGWQKTDLIILAARPAVGKTAFALNLAMNAALQDTNPVPTAFFSLEMSAGQLVKRLLSAVSEIPLEKITRGHLEDHELVQLTQRMEKLAKAPLFIDDQAAISMFELKAKVRRLKQKHDIGLVIIDYMQLMRGSDSKNTNRQEEVSKISRDLKTMAKDFEIPIIALSQLNRNLESRKDNKMPQLSDLRESGAIEQDADMVMFLYRPEYHNANEPDNGAIIEGLTKINIAKHRNGKTGVVDVRAVLAYQQFEDLPDSYFAGQSSGFGGETPTMEKSKITRETGFEGPKISIQDGYATKPSKANDYDFGSDKIDGEEPAF